MCTQPSSFAGDAGQEEDCRVLLHLGLTDYRSIPFLSYDFHLYILLVNVSDVLYHSGVPWKRSSKRWGMKALVYRC